jgi:O-antigen/teichoic acid export membrane protein
MTRVLSAWKYVRQIDGKNTWSKLRRLTKTRLEFLGMRYLAAAFVIAEALVMAYILGPGQYGPYALVYQIASLLIFCGAGSASGYVFAYYKTPVPELTRYYVAGATVQYLIGAVLFAALFFWIRPLWLFSVILLVISVPFLITEPMLRVRNRFTLTAMPQGLTSFMTLGLLGIVLVQKVLAKSEGIDLQAALWIMLLGNLFGYVIYYLIASRGWRSPAKIGGVTEAIWHSINWRQYFSNVLKPGLLLNLASVILMLFTFVDRLFIERYQPVEILGIYLFSWQLSQGALLLLTSMNKISGIRIGEQTSRGRVALQRQVGRQFRFTSLGAILSFSMLILGAMFLERTWYAEYEQLALLTLLLSTGYLSLYTVSSVSSVLFYERRQLQLILVYLLLIVLSVSGNVLAIYNQWWFGIPIAITSVSMIFMSILLFIYTKHVVEGIPEMGEPA